MSQDTGNVPPRNPDDPYGLGPQWDTEQSILPPEQRPLTPPPAPPAPDANLAPPATDGEQPRAAPPPAPVKAPAGPLAVHHIGIAVRSIDQAMHFYGDTMGLSIVDRRLLADRQLNVAFVQAGNLLIELLEPTSPDTTVARFLERRGPGLHHLCFGTPNIEEHLRDLKDKGVLLIDETPRPGAHGDVAFLDPAAAHGVLVELIRPNGTLEKA